MATLAIGPLSNQIPVPKPFDEPFYRQDEYAVFSQPCSLFSADDDSSGNIGMLGGYRPQPFQVLIADVAARFASMAIERSSSKKSTSIPLASFQYVSLASIFL